MCVLGLDPGLQTTGYAVLEVLGGHAAICEAGVIRSTAERVAADMAPRLLVLYDALVEIITQWKPETIAVETLCTLRSSTNRNINGTCPWMLFPGWRTSGRNRDELPEYTRQEVGHGAWPSN